MNTLSLFHHRFFRPLALTAVAAGALFVGVVAGERPAAAQVVEVAPPAVRVEVVPRPPAPHLFWTHGYWGWYGGRYTWFGGRWERERPGWAYEHPRWVHEGRGWRYAPAHWHRW